MPPANGAAIACHGLTVTVPGRLLVERLELELNRGDFLAVLGRNGAGKTLTMHTLAGLRPAESGEVRLDDTPLHHLRRSRLARKLALLPQAADDIFPATVLETVLVGRHPHIAPLGWETDRDRSIARQALARLHLEAFADRSIGSLSGGERRRVAIAQVLTQQPDVFLLDEPTNHLDPQHQLDVLDLFAEQARGGATVVATLHDVNLAVRFANRCLLLYGDGCFELGATSSVLNEHRLSELYATSMEAVRWRGRDLFIAGPAP
jgi:iron complex transport system ATP-binding protein